MTTRLSNLASLTFVDVVFDVTTLSKTLLTAVRQA